MHAQSAHYMFSRVGGEYIKSGIKRSSEGVRESSSNGGKYSKRNVYMLSPLHLLLFLPQHYILLPPSIDCQPKTNGKQQKQDVYETTTKNKTNQTKPNRTQNTYTIKIRQEISCKYTISYMVELQMNVRLSLCVHFPK